ncbi:hypothetical protein DFH29DRAFT_838909 [Suillus ampliporus]|nr:hypothetical protein DFH29DRAFT_838909 [Suillus ampliporus]
MTPTELSKHAEPCHNGVSPIPVTFPGASRGTGFSSQTVPAPKVQAKVSFRCYTCQKSFSSKDGLCCHIKAIHTPKAPAKKTHPCASCNQTFRKKSKLTAHTIVAHPQVRCLFNLSLIIMSPRYTDVRSAAGAIWGLSPKRDCNQVAAYPAGPACSLCQFTCLSQPVLDNHVAAVHTRAVCSGCDVAFISEEGLYYHYLQSSKDAHPKCIECDLEFENDAAYATHHQTSHPELSRPVSPPAPYPCSLCDNGFNLLSALDDHMAATHPFTCGMCDFACPEEELIQEHFASAHSCPVCHEGVFANADLLNEHLVDHATPYYCEVCQTRYAEEEGLRQHYQDSPDDIHPSCTRCGLGFQDAGDYYDHTETIHPRYPVNCVMVHYLILGSFLCTT